jgi:hypothetical protein
MKCGSRVAFREGMSGDLMTLVDAGQEHVGIDHLQFPYSGAAICQQTGI